jgi:hypothetical protein
MNYRKRKTMKRKTTKRKTMKRKTMKRKTMKRKTMKRKTMKRKINPNNILKGGSSEKNDYGLGERELAVVKSFTSRDYEKIKTLFRNWLATKAPRIVNKNPVDHLSSAITKIPTINSDEYSSLYRGIKTPWFDLEVGNVLEDHYPSFTTNLSVAQNFGNYIFRLNTQDGLNLGRFSGKTLNDISADISNISIASQDPTSVSKADEKEVLFKGLLKYKIIAISQMNDSLEDTGELVRTGKSWHFIDIEIISQKY